MSRVTELENEIKELENKITDLQNELEFEKQNEEFVYPFKNDEKYWVLWHDGYIRDYIWDGSDFDKARYFQGNIFKTKAEAERERDKRALLTRFRQFRDKCNDGRRCNWEDITEEKYFICYDSWTDDLVVSNSNVIDSLVVFGYFIDEDDAENAAEMFDKQIRKLFIEVKK